MAYTNIEWADRAWNPVTGCTKVSQGCKNCYAEGVAERFWHKQYPLLPVETRGDLDATNTFYRPRRFTDVQTHDDRLAEPLKWRKPARIFVNSMSDLFHEDVPDKFILNVFTVMAVAKWHTYLVLTKRPERMRRLLASWNADDLNTYWYGYSEETPAVEAWPLPNVHLGVSVENQQTADERIPLLLQTPAAVRWVSYEPALGPVDFLAWTAKRYTMHVSASVDGMLSNKSFDALCGDDGRALSRREAEIQLRILQSQGIKLISAADGKCEGFSHETGCPTHWHPRLDWIVVGGESGPGARPFDVAWARQTVQQGKAAGVPVFVKQLGALPYEFIKDPSYASDYAGDLRAFTMSLPKLEAIGKAHDRIVNTICNQQITDRKGGDPAEWPEDLRVRELPEVRA